MQETWVQSLGWEGPPEKEMATHSSILAWEIPWTEDPGGLQTTGLQWVGHDLATKHQQQYIKIWCRNIILYTWKLYNVLDQCYLDLKLKKKNRIRTDEEEAKNGTGK